MIKKVTNKEVPVRIRARRAGDPPILVADPSKANKVLGWVPRYSSLDSIVERAWRWQDATRSRGDTPLAKKMLADC